MNRIIIYFWCPLKATLEIMKKLFEQYAAYNLWANQRIIEVINNLSDDVLNNEITSSFNSIYKTLLHLWDVEDIWWQRLKLAEPQV